MFTGIIEGTGLVERVSSHPSERRFVIHPLFDMGNISDGASIAVNGVCLSVEQHDAVSFTTYASRETLSRTNLSTLSPQDSVNLEQALVLGSRLDGHIVTGHIDCVATMLSSRKAGESLILRIEFPPAQAPYIIPRGSVALNGISLTVNECGTDFLEVNIIPDSQKRTNLTNWTPGTPINMETDIIGKYVRHMLAPFEGSPNLDRNFLAAHGFI